MKSIIKLLKKQAQDVKVKFRVLLLTSNCVLEEKSSYQAGTAQTALDTRTYLQYGKTIKLAGVRRTSSQI